jgi:sugar-phosphatase
MIRVTCDALLFDMDGVLIDSTPAVARVWRKWAIGHGFDAVEVVGKAHGRPSLATVREYLSDGDHAGENRMIEQNEMEDLEGVVALPNAIELVSSLPANRWAIVTSCTRALAEVRLRAAKLPRPRCFVTADDISNGKPAAEPYLKAAEMLRFNPRDCLVVEDAPAGIRSGKAAGAKVIAFCTTMEESELREAGADWILRNCSGISVNASGTEEQLSLVLTPAERPGAAARNDLRRQ